MFALALLVLRLAWGWEAERRVRAATERLRAAGEPVLLKDFLEPEVAFEGSAADYLLQGVSTLQRGQPDSPNLDLDIETLLPALRDPKACSRLLEPNAKSLDALHRAAQQPYVVWPVEHGAGGRDPKRQMYGGFGALVRLGCVASLVDHCAGDDAAALAHLEDAFVNARHVQALQPSVLSNLNRCTCERDITSVLEELLPRLGIGNGAAGAQDARAALQTELRGFVARLLDDSDFSDGRRLALLGERAETFDVCLHMSDDPALHRTLFRQITVLSISPAWKLDAVRVLEHLSQLLRAGEAPSWPAAEALEGVEPSWDYESRVLRLARAPSLWAVPPLLTAPPYRYAAWARRRMAATAIALRLFEMEHGCRPERLAEVVPEYLPAVPQDPFTLKSELGYYPSQPNALIYSVGPDGKYEGRTTDEDVRRSGGKRFDVAFRLGLPADSLKADNDDAEPE